MTWLLHLLAAAAVILLRLLLFGLVAVVLMLVLRAVRNACAVRDERVGLELWRTVRVARAIDVALAVLLVAGVAVVVLLLAFASLWLSLIECVAVVRLLAL